MSLLLALVYVHYTPYVYRCIQSVNDVNSSFPCCPRQADAINLSTKRKWQMTNNPSSVCKVLCSKSVGHQTIFTGQYHHPQTSLLWWNDHPTITSWTNFEQQVTHAFLEYTKGQGNDLSTAHGGFPGLRPGDMWCLCAARWRQVLLKSQFSCNTHIWLHLEY